ncbi:MAG: hypothetical protein E3J72_03480 [Planctomycetota bacterium]|nr:MAG: hypothetical protein E3J72_03480 [Planctomycetota bacterium]
MADGKKLSYTTAYIGPSPDNRSYVDSFFTLAFKDADFELTAANGAEFHVSFEFNAVEVRDSLVPAASGIRLLYSTCEVAITRRGKTIFRDKIDSSVNSGKDPKKVSGLIIKALMQRAYYIATKALDKELSGE